MGVSWEASVGFYTALQRNWQARWLMNSKRDRGLPQDQMEDLPHTTVSLYRSKVTLSWNTWTLHLQLQLQVNSRPSL